MRFRRLIVCSILLALLPAAPALAGEPPATPAPTSSAPAADAPQGEPPAGDAPSTGAPSAGPPEEKLEEGLAVAEGTSRVIVELTDPAQTAPVAAQAVAQDAQVVLQPETQPAAQPFIVVEGTAEELAALAEDPRVAAIHRDRAYPPTAISSLPVIGADKVHAEGRTGAGQAIAVLDTGIDRDHPFFGGRVVAEACFSSTEYDGVESLCPNGQSQMIGTGAADAEYAKCLLGGENLCEHGTHVAGIAAGQGGVAPGANIVAVQVFSRVNDEDACGASACLMAFESSLRLAMDHVASLAPATPIAAMNLSLGGQLSDTSCDTSEEGQVFKPKIDDLLAKGVATVVAAGNEYFAGTSFPACISSAVAVGASNNNDEIADFSNTGSLLDLFAPGVDIESSVPDDTMAAHSGTSMAAPHVAGALAVLKAAFPDQAIGALVEKLKTSGRPFAYQADGVQVVTPRLDLAAATSGAGPQPTVSQSAPAPAPSESGPSPEPTDENPQDDDPGQSEDPDPTDSPDPSPVPLPTVTVTVTVTATPPAAPASVCTRGTAGTRMSAKEWAVELYRGTGQLSDETLTCYLKLAHKSSKVFPELTKASSLGKAYRVLKAAKGARAKLDRALLTAWLDWAHGATSTLEPVRAAEKVRLAAKASGASLKKAAASLGK
ncbi:S8 family peptidase [Nonomuraea africana]|uniref:Subtilisin family serine protease n=1 Tax=Nonomuraea africana TaxID=46171 RepID=A0ABR9KN83_9ACTN|nr:S8 family serine peptidase [Nonomuraea africana]MBE1563053.1 subtilisin family serine protease [Nonomuraea africana]